MEVRETLQGEICNFFNEKIVNIRNKIRKDEVIGNKSIPSDISTLSSFHETSETELQNIMLNMNSKSCSLDPIPTWLVKSSFNELKMAMLYIVNRSLVIENTFPEALKHAIVTLSPSKMVTLKITTTIVQSVTLLF